MVPPRPCIIEQRPLELKYRQDDEPLHSFEMPNTGKSLGIDPIRESEWDGELPEEEEVSEQTEAETFLEKLISFFGWQSR